jgi:hypothetical protein
MDRELCGVHDRCLGMAGNLVEVCLSVLHEGIRTDTVGLLSTVNLVCFGRSLANRLRILLER